MSSAGSCTRRCPTVGPTSAPSRRSFPPRNIDRVQPLDSGRGPARADRLWPLGRAGRRRRRARGHELHHGVPHKRADLLQEGGNFLGRQCPKARTKNQAPHSGEWSVRLLTGGVAHSTPLPARPTRKPRVPPGDYELTTAQDGRGPDRASMGLPRGVSAALQERATGYTPGRIRTFSLCLRRSLTSRGQGVGIPHR